jgi:hypothetical protein
MINISIKITDNKNAAKNRTPWENRLTINAGPTKAADIKNKYIKICNVFAIRRVFGSTGLVTIIFLSLVSKRTEEKSEIREVMIKNMIIENTILIWNR